MNSESITFITIIILVAVIMAIFFYLKLLANVKKNTNTHLINKLRVARVEMEIFVKTQNYNQWEQKWIEPYTHMINSGIFFLSKCREHGIYQVRTLDKYIGNNANRLSNSSDIEFARLINEELPFIPLPIKSPFPDQMLSVQEQINSAIKYGNIFENPLSCFIHDYLSLSKDAASRNFQFNNYFGMQNHSSVSRKE